MSTEPRPSGTPTSRSSRPTSPGRTPRRWPPRWRRTCSAAHAAGRRSAASPATPNATSPGQRLADSIDRPSPTPLGRLTGGHWFVRSVIATPAMVQAALAALVLVGLVPLAAAMTAGDAGLVVLLVLAPLAPMAAVALAYRDWADPAGEISLATPSAGLKLVALRALVVSLAALPFAFLVLIAVDTWAGDVPLRLGSAWCLPGLALAALVLLAGTTRLDPLHVAVGISAAWAVTW